MVRPREYDDELRLRLLDVAGELLATEGPHALSTRRVAAAAQTSTSAIYALLGSKAELVRAMYTEGFRRLAVHLAAVGPAAGPDDLLDRLARLGRAYLASALESPALYTVMFGNPVPEFVPDEADALAALATLSVLIEAVRDCVDAGLLDGPVEDVAMVFWATAHGIASLANANLCAPETAWALLDRASSAAIAGLVPR